MSDPTTPQDSAAMSPASTGSVAELLETIAAFMDQTDRFKGGAVPVVTPEATKARMAFFRLRKLLEADATKPTLIYERRILTGEQREAIAFFARLDSGANGNERYAATLRGLLNGEY